MSWSYPHKDFTIIKPTMSGKVVKRGPGGRFAKGTKGGPGNPLAKRVIRVRAKFLEEVRLKDVAEVTRAIINAASGGDMQAAKLFLEYALGRPGHVYDPRQGAGAEADGQQSGGPQYTARERVIIARAMLREAERELRGQEAIDVEAEEVSDDGSR